MIYLTRYRADDPRKLPVEPSSKTHFKSLDDVKQAMRSLPKVYESPSMVVYAGEFRLCFTNRRFS